MIIREESGRRIFRQPRSPGNLRECESGPIVSFDRGIPPRRRRAASRGAGASGRWRPAGIAPPRPRRATVPRRVEVPEDHRLRRPGEGEGWCRRGGRPSPRRAGPRHRARPPPGESGGRGGRPGDPGRPWPGAGHRIGSPSPGPPLVGPLQDGPLREVPEPEDTQRAVRTARHEPVRAGVDRVTGESDAGRRGGDRGLFLCTGRPRSRSCRTTRPSLVATSRIEPPSSRATDRTSTHAATRPISRPLATSQTVAAPSDIPAAIRRPAASKAMARMPPAISERRGPHPATACRGAPRRRRADPGRPRPGRSGSPANGRPGCRLSGAGRTPGSARWRTRAGPWRGPRR